MNSDELFSIGDLVGCYYNTIGWMHSYGIIERFEEHPRARILVVLNREHEKRSLYEYCFKFDKKENK